MTKLLLAAAFTVFSATTASAQSSAPPKNSPQSDSTISAVVGTWEGSVYSDHVAESAIRLTFSNSPAFGVVVSIVSNGQQFVDGVATELTVDGTAVMWRQGLMGVSCKANAVLIAGSLKGGFDCGQGGATFLVKKK